MKRMIIASLLLLGTIDGSYASDNVSKQIELLNSQIQAQLEGLHADHQKQLDVLNKQLQAQLKSVQSHLEAEIKKSNAISQTQIKQVQTNLQKQIQDIQKQATHATN